MMTVDVTLYGDEQQLLKAYAIVMNATPMPNGEYIQMERGDVELDIENGRMVMEFRWNNVCEPATFRPQLLTDATGTTAQIDYPNGDVVFVGKDASVLEIKYRTLRIAEELKRIRVYTHTQIVNALDDFDINGIDTDNILTDLWGQIEHVCA